MVPAGAERLIITGGILYTAQIAAMCHQFYQIADSAGKRVETVRGRRYRVDRSAETKRVTARWKSILVAAMAGGAIVIAEGCMQTQEIDQTLPPYASISDEGRDPASAPKPPPSDDSCGVMCSIGSAIVSPFENMFGSSN
jgi:hypothetical protein